MLLGIATMSSCIDNDYDLSDIDSTVRVDVNDLVLPVNLDDITLKSIFNIKEGDRVQIVDGQYAFIEDGSFTSDEIKINEVKNSISLYSSRCPDYQHRRCSRHGRHTRS